MLVAQERSQDPSLDPSQDPTKPVESRPRASRLARPGAIFLVVPCFAFAFAFASASGCASSRRPAAFQPSARRTCLVLSAGGTRGVAHLGAVSAVREAGLPIACVVGTSVGALVGSLYASAPHLDTTERFRRLARAYLEETEREAHQRGRQTGIALAAVAATLSGGILVPATAAFGGYVLGAATTTRADRSRLERTLRTELAGVRIEALPIAFATLHHERAGQGLVPVVDRAGDLAQAVGSSIANPFVFEDVDVTVAPRIDPGSDRVAATPVEDACRLFPDANLLVVNISGTPAFFSAAMRCPTYEIVIDVPAPPPQAFFQGGPAFDRAWRAGHQKVAAVLARPPGA
ncbi:MAG: patatin-like phospholipase family protein [Haliangium ochraceum]